MRLKTSKTIVQAEMPKKSDTKELQLFSAHPEDTPKNNRERQGPSSVFEFHV